MEFLGLGVEVVPVAVLEAAADTICTVASVGAGAGPVLPGERLLPHAHVNAIGADLIGKCEVPLHVLKSAFVTTDHRGQALRDGESQHLVESDPGPDLMGLCADPSLAERHRDGPTVFDSTGFALEDHIAFGVLLEPANDAGIGDYVRMEHLPEAALAPYAFAWHGARRPPSAVHRRGASLTVPGGPGRDLFTTPGSAGPPGCAGCSRWCAAGPACRRRR